MELIGPSAESRLPKLEVRRADEWLRQLFLHLQVRGLLRGVVTSSLAAAQPSEDHWLQRANLGTLEGLGKMFTRDRRLGTLTPAVSERLLSSVSRMPAVEPSGSGYSHATLGSRGTQGVVVVEGAEAFHDLAAHTR